MHFAEMIGMISVVITMTTGIIAILRLSLEHIRRSRADRFQADFYNKLLDRFGASTELFNYLQGEHGLRLLQAPPPARPAPHSRILNAIQFGMVGTGIGSALLFLNTYVQNEAKYSCLFFGAVFLSAGLGLLLSSVASYQISKKLGLIETGKME